MAIHGYFHAFLDLFYSRSCLHCNRNLNNSYALYLCEDCIKGISYVSTDHCIRCGAALGPHSISTVKEGCIKCKGRRLSFTTTTSVTYYEGAMKTLIHKFKYSRQKFLFHTLNEILLARDKVQAIVPNIDVVVPVPLHWIKKMRRGFNQSELLAWSMQHNFSKPVSTNNLCRIKNTTSQTQLSKKQRQANIRDAFHVKDPKSFQEKRILLVDDVLTTGVTVAECAKILKQSGAQSVHLLILATAKDPG
ncbi:MAG: ComF family protein [Candidatus Brocadia sp.]|nr:ComF family protein [Candidatus Brocadia sp.]MDG6027215.1 ComF family protein [Candidatus Brocadia sp.]